MDKQTHVKSRIAYFGIAFIFIVTMLVILHAAEGIDYAVSTCVNLQDIQNDVSGNYSLINDIDCSDTINWNAGAGFVPIDNFTGILDGNGFVVSNLFINRLSELDMGLFGYSPLHTSSSAVIQNIGLENINFTCGQYCGAIAGWNGGILRDSYATGSIIGQFNGQIGGLVGVNVGIINNSYANVSLCSYQNKAGLSINNAGIIENCYAIGSFDALGNCDNGLNRAGLCAITYSGTSIGKSFFNDEIMLTTNPKSGCMSGGLGTTELAKNTSEMQKKSTYAGWDFINTWDICTRANPNSYPILRVFGGCCAGNFVCDEFTACGLNHQDCLSAHDTNCGYTYDAALDGDLSQWGRNCSINANTQSVDFQSFDLRYPGNQFIFAVLLIVWIICLSLSFILRNHIFYILAFVFGILLGIILFQFMWILSVAILLIEVYIGIRYLPMFEN